MAVWILYPLSRIEVYTTLPEKQYRLDNDVTLTTLARSFNKKHFNVAQVKEGFPHPVTNFAFAPCRYVVFMHPTVLPFGRDFLNTHMHYMENNNISQPIAYWEENKLLVSISSSTLFGKFIKIAGQADVYLEHLDTLRLVENYEVYARLRGSGVWEYKTVPEGYLHNRTTGTSGAEATVVGPALTLRECMALYNTEWSVHNTVVPTQPLVMDMLVIPEDWVDTDTGVDSCEQNYKTGGAPETACDHPDLSGLPICTAPISRVPYFWLTSATPRLTVGRALCLNQSTFEHIVQHLDPIVQDSLMQKIFGFIPTDIAQILRLFDAVSFPNVVSLVDSRHQNWIENCTN